MKKANAMYPSLCCLVADSWGGYTQSQINNCFTEFNMVNAAVDLKIESFDLNTVYYSVQFRYFLIRLFTNSIPHTLLKC